MTEETIASTRYRINLSSLAKGGYNYDCTVESSTMTREEILAESDALRKALEERYPRQGVI